jgi:hypothetical protein
MLDSLPGTKKKQPSSGKYIPLGNDDEKFKSLEGVSTKIGGKKLLIVGDVDDEQIEQLVEDLKTGRLANVKIILPYGAIPIAEHANMTVTVAASEYEFHNTPTDIIKEYDNVVLPDTYSKTTGGSTAKYYTFGNKDENVKVTIPDGKTVFKLRGFFAAVRYFFRWIGAKIRAQFTQDTGEVKMSLKHNGDGVSNITTAVSSVMPKAIKTDEVTKSSGEDLTNDDKEKKPLIGSKDGTTEEEPLELDDMEVEDESNINRKSRKQPLSTADMTSDKDTEIPDKYSDKQELKSQPKSNPLFEPQEPNMMDFLNENQQKKTLPTLKSFQPKDEEVDNTEQTPSENTEKTNNLRDKVITPVVEDENDDKKKQEKLYDKPKYSNDKKEEGRKK